MGGITRKSSRVRALLCYSYFMENNRAGRKKLFCVLILVLIIGIYSFTQALQVPLTRLSAEKVMSAGEILDGKMKLSGWQFHIPELPVYLLCVKVFGLSTFSEIAANTLFFMAAFCAGTLVLAARFRLDLPNLLIWLAVAGLPDPVWISAFQEEPFLICGLILLPYFLSAFPKKHRIGLTAAVFLFGILAVFPLRAPETNTHAVHETLRALQAVFRADFSQQPLLKAVTGRYFLMTVILLLMFWSLFYTIRLGLRKRDKQDIRYLYAVLMVLTILICFLPMTGDREQKKALCAWLPFGTAFLLISLMEEGPIRGLRIAGHRLSFETAAVVFAVLTILFGISPIVSSRPASPADHAVIYLNEQNQYHGYCEQADLALLTVASKGRIHFTTDPNDKGNTFSVLSSEKTAEKARKNEIIPPYQILIY